MEMYKQLWRSETPKGALSIPHLISSLFHSSEVRTVRESGAVFTKHPGWFSPILKISLSIFI